jgi:hypothetical protein
MVTKATDMFFRIEMLLTPSALKQEQIMKVQENLSLGRRNILHMSYQCSVIKG